MKGPLTEAPPEPPSAAPTPVGFVPSRPPDPLMEEPPNPPGPDLRSGPPPLPVRAGRGSSMLHDAARIENTTDNITAVARALARDIVAQSCSGRTNPRHGVDQSIPAVSSSRRNGGQA